MTIFILKTALLLLLLTIAGGGVTVWFVPRLRLNLLLTLGISFVFGVALFSVLTTTTILKGGFEYVSTSVWIAALAGLVSIVAAAYRYRWLLAATVRPTRSQLALLILALVIVAPVAVHAVLYPLTAWDAKAIWLLKAKALYSEPYVPNTLYENEVFSVSHVDYPIGWPAVIAGHYEWFGGVSEQPVALSFVAFWGVLMLLLVGAAERFAGSSLSKHRGALFGLGAALLLVVAVGEPLYLAGLGLADLPLAVMFFVATLALIGLSRSSAANRLYWWLLGLFAVLSGASLKNEGMTFAMLYLAVSAVSWWWMRRTDRHAGVRTTRAKPFGALSAALPIGALLLLPLVLWQTLLRDQALGTNLFGTVNRSVQEYLDRGIETVLLLVRELGNVERWGWALLPAVVLCAGMVLAWRHHKLPLVGLAPLVVVLGQLAVYVVVYILSPHDLVWHVSTSIDRILLHLVPSLYLIITTGLQLLLEPKRVYSSD